MTFGVSGWEWFMVAAAGSLVPLIILLNWIEHRLNRRDARNLGRYATLIRLITDDIWKTETESEKAMRRDQKQRVLLVRKSVRNRRNVKVFLLAVAAATVTFAAARPQWGVLQEEVHKKGIELVLVVDTSYSMQCEDIAPNRLEKAKRIIGSLLSMMSGHRVGLVSFAQTTRLHCPLTLDFRGLQSILEHSLSMGPGTNVENAVLKALQVLKGSEARTQAVCILSDGEGHEGDIESAVRAANENDVQIFSIGIGSVEGGPIPELSQDGTIVYKKQNGELVWTRLQENTLIRLADETGGSYYRTTPGETEVIQLLNDIEQLEKTEFSQTVKTRREERFGIFLFLAVVALALEAGLGDYRRITWEDADE